MELGFREKKVKPRDNRDRSRRHKLVFNLKQFYY